MAFFSTPINGECCDDPCTKKEDACDPCSCPCDPNDFASASNTFLWIDYIEELVESAETSSGCTKKFLVANDYEEVEINECKIGEVEYSEDYETWIKGSLHLNNDECVSPFGRYYDDDDNLRGALVRSWDDVTYVIDEGFSASYGCDQCEHTITRNCEVYSLTEAECAGDLPLCDDVDVPCDECNEPCCTGNTCGSGVQGSGTQGSGPQGSGCCEETNDCCPQVPCCPPNSTPCGGAPCCGSGISNPPVCGSGVGSGVQGSGCCSETNNCDPNPCCDNPPDCECEQCYDGGPCEETYCFDVQTTVCDDNTFTEPTSPLE